MDIWNQVHLNTCWDNQINYSYFAETAACPKRQAVFYVIGNFVPYDIKTLREDATDAQLKMQADACAHQRAKSRKATLCYVVFWRIIMNRYLRDYSIMNLLPSGEMREKKIKTEDTDHEINQNKAA